MGIELISRGVHDAVIKRINTVKENLYSSQHYHRKLLVPPVVAFILEENPNFVAPAVNAFYYRDVDDILSPYTTTNLIHQKHEDLF